MAQAALLFFAMSLATYWMLVRKKKRETAEWVPAALVKAYLDRVRADERDTRIKLFGEDSGASLVAAPMMSTLTAAVGAHQPQQIHQPQQVIMTSNDPALAKEIEALRVQLTMADQRSIEFDKMVNALKAEKAALEARLAQAAAAPAAGAAAPAADPAAQKELLDLRAKLQEYEVIEDDLANLKKFQKENEQLRQQLAGAGIAPATLSVVPGGAQAAPAGATMIQGVTEKITTPVTVISGGAAPAAAAPVTTVAAAPAPAVGSVSEANTNVLQPISPSIDAGAPAPAAAAPAAAPAPAAPAAAAAPDKSAKQKEEELLSEFEKMLAS